MNLESALGFGARSPGSVGTAPPWSRGCVRSRGSCRSSTGRALPSTGSSVLARVTNHGGRGQGNREQGEDLRGKQAEEAAALEIVTAHQLGRQAQQAVAEQVSVDERAWPVRLARVCPE